MAWDDAPPDAQVGTPTSAGGSWDSLPPDEQGLTGQLPRTGLDVLKDAISQLVPKQVPPQLYQPQAMANAMPAALGAAGSFVGPGGFTGGMMVGQNIKDLANTALQNPNAPQTSMDVLKNTGKAGLEGLAGELTGYGIGKIVDAGSSLLKLIKNAKNAEALGTLETPTTAGQIAKSHATINQSGIKSNINDLYSKVPPDISGIETPQFQSAGDTHINNIKSLSPSLQKELKPITDIATDAQNMKQTTLQNANGLQSSLSNLAKNGVGSQKKYAYDLLQGLEKDLDTFANQGIRAKAQGVLSANMTQPGVRAAGMGPNEIPSINPNADAVAKLNAAKSAYGDNAQLLKQPVIKALQKAAPQDMTDTIFKSGDVSKLFPAQRYLGDGYKVLQQDFFNQLYHASNIAKTLGKYDSTFLNQALTPEMNAGLQAKATLQKLINNVKTGTKVVGLTGESVGGLALLRSYLKRK